jgi:uncharacterized repeat protein (TIGR01451 family)
MEDIKKEKVAKKDAVKENKTKRISAWVWIVITAVVIAIAAVAGAYYYFFYYMKINFEDNEFNFITSDTDGTVKPDDFITYTINFKNTGNTIVNDIVVLASIPENTTFSNSSETGELESAGIIEFNIDELAKDEEGNVSYTVEVNKPLGEGVLIKNSEVTLKYQSRGGKEVYKINKSLENIVESSPVFSKFNIEMTDENGDNLNMGDVVLFDISLENTGDMNASDVMVVCEVSSKLSILESSISKSGKYNKTTGIVSWNIDKLNIEDPQDFAFKAKISGNFIHLEKFKTIASVEYIGSVENEVSTKGEVWAFPDFSQSLGSVMDINGGSVWAGDTLRYTINVKNTGLRAGEDFKLFCPIPSGASYISKSGTSEGISWNDETGGLVWDIDRLEVDEEKIVTFDVTIGSSMAGGGQIEANFYIEGDQQHVEIEPIFINVRSYIFQTVVCMGDSQIVHTNWPAVLDSLLEGTYPHAEFKTIGSGIPQETSYLGARRFDSTVGCYNPQIIIIGYGTNDTGGGISLFKNGMTDLINKAKSTGATVLVHSIGYIDSRKHPEKKSFTTYNNVLKEVCASCGVPYIDLYSSMAQDPGRYLDSDGMHLSGEGGSLLARLVFNTIVNYLDGDGQRK